MKKNNKLVAKPLWHGVILVAGGAVGAGMFALPLVSAGAWFAWSTLGLIGVCVLTYLAARLLVEVNVSYPPGSSFDTLIRETLGDAWARVNNISIAFIMFILMYAYITAGAGIIAKSVMLISDQATNAVPRSLLSFIFAGLVALFIWLGTSMVSRVSTVLMFAMCIAFVTANSGLLSSLEVSSIFGNKLGSVTHVWSALPVFVTAFACAGLVPSLSSHYQNRKERINLSILLGLATALLVYVIWLISTLGNIPRDGFIDVANNGGGLDALVSVLQSRTDSSIIGASLTWFSHFAVITSFLSIALGLAHFLVDKFKFKINSMGRAKSVALAFLPPLIASVIAPYGFVSAIAYAGVFVAFSFFIVPALMYRSAVFASGTFSHVLYLAVLSFGALVITLKLFAIFAWLPSYP